MVATSDPTTDLRRGPLGDLRALDLRSRSRDPWADEAAVFDRLRASYAGLDDAAWRLPGAAPSDAGGSDWSLAEHVGHVVDWQELAIDYLAVATSTGRWPADDDFDGGDFDRYNERRRAPWTTMPAETIVARFDVARPRLLASVQALPPDVLRGHDAWPWVYLTLHGHYLDHLAVIEPWTAVLRVRQVDGDPFVDDPRAADLDAFWAADQTICRLFDATVRSVPLDRWDAGDVTPGWSLRDHVGHLADWADEGVRAIEVFERRGHWLADPDEGVDAWNARHVEAARDEPAAATLARFDRSTAALRDAIGGLTVDDLRSPDGWSWTYDCLHGHTRKHLAMFGPWCAAVSWPPA